MSEHHTSVWRDMPFTRHPKAKERLTELSAALTKASDDAKARRERVLKHEWAQKRLCQIFGYTKAEQWRGYIPPRLDPETDGEQSFRPLNQSPYRRDLIRLLHEVAEFERTGVIPSATPEPGEQMTIPVQGE